MKKSYLFLLTFLFLFTACEKEQEIPVFQAPQYSDELQVKYVTAQSSLSIQPTSADIDKYLMQVSLSSDMANAKVLEPRILSKWSYSFALNDLEDGTTYYYRYVLQGFYSSINMEVKSFTTNSYSIPEVKIYDPSIITANEAVCHGDAISDGGLDVTEKGICYSLQSDPTIQDSHVKSLVNGLGAYSCLLTDLTPNTTYYICAYAVNAKGIRYSETKSIITLP